MLPGLDGTGLIFAPLLDHLSASIVPRVVPYHTDKNLNLSDYVELVREQCPSGDPFVLLAESFSGPIAVRLLTDPPDNLAGVVFVATFVRYPKPFLLDVARKLPQKPLRKLFETALGCRYFCLGTARGTAVTLFQKAMQQVSTATLTSRLNLLAELPPPQQTFFNGPCLYLQASHDHLVPERAKDELLQILPQMEVATLKGPHTILLAQPESGARLINQFVQRVEEGSWIH
jgi:pimeloyl-ACP methyl ester carboxylesterase